MQVGLTEPVTVGLGSQLSALLSSLASSLGIAYHVPDEFSSGQLATDRLLTRAARLAGTDVGTEPRL
jgi:hypothetical protein